MADILYELKDGRQPTDAELEEVRRASMKPITFDEDCPPLTDEQLSNARRIVSPH